MEVAVLSQGYSDHSVTNVQKDVSEIVIRLARNQNIDLWCCDEYAKEGMQGESVNYGNSKVNFRSIRMISTASL